MVSPSRERIRDLLGPRSLFGPIEVHDEVTSTNEVAAEAARAGADEGLVVLADTQTAGRGRLRRHWVSPPGSSISMSLLLRPGRRAEDWGWLSLVAGLAVASGLDALAPGSPVQLKWPNDVLIAGRKVCGILSERDDTPRGPAAVVGIGINVTLTEDELPVPGATSLALSGLPTDRDQVIAAVLTAFDAAYRQWSVDGHVLEAYRDRCTSIGADLTITVDSTTTLTGVGHDVDTAGRLIVELPDGLRAFTVGDVVHARLGSR